MSKASSKEIILETARALFGEYGYTSTTFKRIAEKSGLALGLITHYFGSKENLFVESSMSILETVWDALEEASSNAPTGLEAVEAFASVYWDFAKSKPVDFMILVRCSPYSDLKDDIARDDVIKRFEELVARLQQHIERGQADGSIVKEDSELLANAVFATLVGGVRTLMLSPYCPDGFYEGALRYVRRALKAG